ncbi:DNA polymerase III subunit beta [Mycoplasma sp. 744]|uniref:DNA polymerase III subunit beta n=1 Tax=Mycoplasma sp. 744 TaxID=3108531 RepID=UPI002B1D3931|nr:DNA polymerase III subunit beta [Mycoplasma sp. 744]MEA4115251.1 DNA polymerase III subunit beta [Mycoplasma sp. 744]
MQISITKKIFEETIDIVSRYTDPINSSYGLRCILFEITKEKITLSATNGFISIVKSINVDNQKIKVIEEGIFLINATLIKNVIRKTSGIINIDDLNGSINIVTDDVNYTLAPNKVEIFNGIEELFNIKKIEIDTHKFKKAIQSVSFATSQDDHVLKCINFSFNDTKIEITATDKYRLARYTLDTKEIFTNEFDISVLSSSVKDLIPNDCPKEAYLFYNSTKFGIEYKNTIITANSSDVTYPKLEYLFDTKEIKSTLKIKKDVFMDLMNKAYVISTPGYKKISLAINKNELKISVLILEIGTSLVKTKNFEFQSEKQNVSFDLDFNFIKESLSVYSDEVVLLIDDKPSKILIISKSNQEAKQIISPTRG